tara:strand:+ start:542 stop:1000 length:459 start_codon:yes stop_codon:yes gene_type:complete
MKKIISALRKKNLKIAVVESCTGGMLSSALTSVAGASKVFSIGLVTYSNLSKIKILGVPKKIIKKYGAVSLQCCLSMVNNLSKTSNCELCVSITGIAGPKGGTKIKPVGLVFIGIKKNKIIRVNKYNFKNIGRRHIQRAATKKAIQLINNLL